MWQKTLDRLCKAMNLSIREHVDGTLLEEEIKRRQEVWFLQKVITSELSVMIMELEVLKEEVGK